MCAGFAQVTLVDLRSSYQSGCEAKRKSTQKSNTHKTPPNKNKHQHQTAGATDVDTPAKAQPPVRQIHLPQGSSSSNWQPSYHPWEQKLHSHWEPHPATAVAWPDEWASSNPQVEEQAQLLWALSDRAVPRYRKPPPEQPEQPTPAKVPTKVRTEREVRFTLSPDECNNPHSSTAKAKPVAALPRKDTADDTEGGAGGGPSDEHLPPPRPGAHPKKCPVQ